MCARRLFEFSEFFKAIEPALFTSDSVLGDGATNKRKAEKRAHPTRLFSSSFFPALFADNDKIKTHAEFKGRTGRRISIRASNKETISQQVDDVWTPVSDADHLVCETLFELDKTKIGKKEMSGGDVRVLDGFLFSCTLICIFWFCKPYIDQ